MHLLTQQRVGTYNGRVKRVVISVKVRPHRKRAATAVRPSQEMAAFCDLVTPDRARQLRAVQCEEKPSS